MLGRTRSGQQWTVAGVDLAANGADCLKIMAAGCVFRSLRSFQRQAGTALLAGLENGVLQSTCQTSHPRSILKQCLSNLDKWCEASPFSTDSHLGQERVCCIPRRTYVTSPKERLDGQGQVSQSSSSIPLETCTDPASGIEAGDDTSIPSENVALDSAFRASPRHDMALLFTCTVCDVRSAKTMSKATYQTGVVIVRCPSCKNLHLIADRYGWFGEPGSVEDFLAEKGIDVRKGSDRSYEFTLEDLSGWTPQGKSEQ